MSVLSFPRIYFKGYASWDPCTFNNNDWQAFPTYDGANAALNWAFLATQGPQPGGITPANFTSTFRPWAITLQNDNLSGDAPAGKRIPAEWNMFGSHAVSFVAYQDKQTTVTGGVADDGTATPGTDPLLGQPIALGQACLVDTNPASFWSSQIYWDQFTLGSKQCGLTGQRQFRMHSRWLNLQRIYNAGKALTQPAASVGACFQTCIPNSPTMFANGTPGSSTYSPLLAALQTAAQQPGAQGVMVRFTAYVNLYFQNGIFNNTSQQPRTYEELAAVLATAWEVWNKSGGKDTSQFFSQPCYSHIVGAVSVWKQGELASVPVGRFLAATQNTVAPVNAAASPPPSPVSLGPAVAEVDFTRKLISVDLNSVIPELASPAGGSDLTKTDLGPITVGVQGADGTFTPLAAPIPYQGYARSAYEGSAGIVDLPFDAASAGAQSLNAGSAVLAIQMQGQTTLAEPNGGYSAQTDSRGIYLDEHEQLQFQVAVLKNGVPAPRSQVLIAQYDNGLGLITSDQTPFVNFTNGARQKLTTSAGVTAVTIVTADAKGIATVGIAAQAPGFPVLAFYPFGADQPLRVPPPFLLGPLAPANPGVPADQMITNAFYTTVRVLPFDSEVPAEFINLWNSTHDPVKAWDFVYNQILYVYDMLFSVMLEHVNLGNRAAVEKAAPTIAGMVSKESFQEDPSAMPITRDMSDGKRTALLLWCYLVQQKYPQTNIDLSVLD